jgi:hypothetical protein
MQEPIAGDVEGISLPREIADSEIAPILILPRLCCGGGMKSEASSVIACWSNPLL